MKWSRQRCQSAKRSCETGSPSADRVIFWSLLKSRLWIVPALWVPVLVIQAVLLYNFRTVRRGSTNRGLKAVGAHPPVDPLAPRHVDEPPASMDLGSHQELLLASELARALPAKPRIAIVTFIMAQPKQGAGTPYNIIPAVSYRDCYCTIHGYACHTELMALSEGLLGSTRIHYNKQLAVRKYLPLYDYVLFADSDVYFNMAKRVEDVLDDTHTVYLSTSEHPNNIVDAGVFMVGNNESSYSFLETWYNYSRHPVLYVDSDNGILHDLLARRVAGYDGECEATKLSYEASYRPCVDKYIGLGVDLGYITITDKLAAAAVSTVEEARAKLEATGVVCLHGHSVGTFFSSSRELYNCSAHALAHNIPAVMGSKRGQ